MSGGEGLANERTALAWHRTALAIVAGSALITRLAYQQIGPLALLSVGVALPLGLWVFVESRARYDTRRRARSRGGRAPAALVVATAAVGVTELAALLA